MKRASVIQGPVVRQSVRFGVVGVSGVIVDFAVFEVCYRIIALPYVIAATISFVFAVSSNYYWNRVWTFRSSRPQAMSTQYLRFLIVCLIGLGIKLGVMIYSVQTLSFSKELGLLAGIAAATLFNFANSKLWVFPQAAGQPGSDPPTPP